MHKQRTLRSIVNATGVGLHTGTKVEMTLRPAPANTGIVFRRVDLSPAVEIPALAANIGDTRLSSCLMRGDVRVSTVEHLMCAFAGLGVDNAFVDLSADEVPIMDGSASPFVFLINSAGIGEQNAAKQYIRIKSKVEVSQGDKFARFDPFDGFKLDFTIDFPNLPMTESDRHVVIDFAEHAFSAEVARARTFTFLHEVEAMRAMGLARGGNLDNAIVLDDYQVLNSGGLRFDNELVRHKVLDAIGDLYLLGHPLIGAYTAHKSGHALNNALCLALLQNVEAWDLVSFDTAEPIPSPFSNWVPATALP